MDFILIIIFILFVIAGLVRNPFKCAIDLVLYVIFTFSFYALLVNFQDQIIGITGYTVSDIGKLNIAQSINSANDTLLSLSKNLGVNLSGIDSALASDELYVQVGYSVVHMIFFIISSIFAPGFACGLGWIIYGIFRKKVKNIKKLPKKLSSLAISIVAASIFISFTFAPFYNLLNKYNNLVTYVNSQELSDFGVFLDSINEKASGIKTNVNDISNKIDKALDDFNSYEPTVDKLDSDITNIINRYDGLVSRIDALSKKNLTDMDRAKVNLAQQHIDEVNDTVTSVKDSKSIKTQYNDYKNEIDKQLNSYDLESYVVTVETYAKDISNLNDTYKKYLSKAKGYVVNYPIYSNMFSFLGNFDFIYLNFSSTVNDIGSFNQFMDVVIKNLDRFINEDLKTIIDAGNTKISEVTTTLNDANKKIDEVETEYEEKKAEINKNIDEANKNIASLNETLDSIEKEVSEIEKNYQ